MGRSVGSHGWSVALPRYVVVGLSVLGAALA